MNCSGTGPPGETAGQGPFFLREAKMLQSLFGFARFPLSCDVLSDFLKLREAICLANCHTFAIRSNSTIVTRLMSSEPTSQDIFIDYVREHHAGLRAFTRSLGVDPLWVDDVAQEAFIVAYNRMDEFEKTRDFGAWVRGIARNLVINERRKSARRKRILSENLTDVLVSTTSVQEEEEEQLGDTATAKLAALRQCIAELPEKSMRMIRAKYEEDVPAPDLAAELNMKPPAVRKALERIRSGLRKCMEARMRPAGA